jgi:hypothetical protein
MEKTRIYLSSIAIYAALITVSYALRLGGDPHFIDIVNIITFVTPVFMLVFGGIAIRYFGLGSLQGKGAFFITLASFTWLLGDVSWIFTSSIITTLGNILYLVGYPLYGIGILYGIIIASPDFFKDRKRLFFIGFIVAATLFVYLRFFPFTWDPQASLIDNFSISSYVIGDSLLIIMLIPLLSTIFEGAYSHAWILFCIGTLLNLFADIYYALKSATYQNGDMIDLLWYFATLCYAAGAVVLKHNAQKAINKASAKAKKA